MKFLKWRIKLKTERLDLDDRIIYLAEQLLQEVMKKDDWNRYVEGLDSVDVYRHNGYNGKVEVSYGNKQITKK